MTYEYRKKAKDNETPAEWKRLGNDGRGAKDCLAVGIYEVRKEAGSGSFASKPVDIEVKRGYNIKGVKYDFGSADWLFGNHTSKNSYVYDSHVLEGDKHQQGFFTGPAKLKMSKLPRYADYGEKSEAHTDAADADTPIFDVWIDGNTSYEDAHFQGWWTQDGGKSNQDAAWGEMVTADTQLQELPRDSNNRVTLYARWGTRTITPKVPEIGEKSLSTNYTQEDVESLATWDISIPVDYVPNDDPNANTPRVIDVMPETLDANFQITYPGHGVDGGERTEEPDFDNPLALQDLGNGQKGFKVRVKPILGITPENGESVTKQLDLTYKLDAGDKEGGWNYKTDTQKMTFKVTITNNNLSVKEPVIDYTAETVKFEAEPKEQSSGWTVQDIKLTQVASKKRTEKSGKATTVTDIVADGATTYGLTEQLDEWLMRKSGRWRVANTTLSVRL